MHYLLSYDKINYKAAGIMLKYTIEYLEDQQTRTMSDRKQVSDSMTNILLFIISKMNPKLVAQYLRLCSFETPTPYQVSLPEFGHVKKRAMFSQSLVAQPETLQQMIHKGDHQLVFTTVLPRLDYDPRSDDMLQQASKFCEITNEEIFKTPAVAHTINHLWNEIYNQMMLLTIVFSILIS